MQTYCKGEDSNKIAADNNGNAANSDLPKYDNVSVQKETKHKQLLLQKLLNYLLTLKLSTLKIFFMTYALYTPVSTARRSCIRTLTGEHEYQCYF